MEKSDKKTEFENLKKTAEAHKTLSEETAKKSAEEATEKMIKESSDDKDVKNSKDNEDSKNTPVKSHSDGDGKTQNQIQKKSEESGKEELIGWEPKTKLGQDVQNGKIKNIDEILDNNKKILEEQIVDSLIDIKSDLIAIGQSKGKFGGGKRRAWRQTQRKTKEGNRPKFSAMAIVGDENGHIGLGEGNSTETLPARDKSIRKAKLNIIKIKRACSAFDCSCSEPHTIPFEISGKSGSVVVKLIPAPQGTGLVVGDELKKILKFAGIKDVYSKTFGRKRTTFNLIKACFSALKKTNTRG